MAKRISQVFKKIWTIHKNERSKMEPSKTICLTEKVNRYKEMRKEFQLSALQADFNNFAIGQPLPEIEKALKNAMTELTGTKALIHDLQRANALYFLLENENDN